MNQLRKLLVGTSAFAAATLALVQLAGAAAAPPTIAQDLGYVEGSSPAKPVILSAVLVQQDLPEEPVSCALPPEYVEVELSDVTAEMAVLRVTVGDAQYLTYPGTQVALPTGSLTLPVEVSIEAFDSEGYRSEPATVMVEDIDDRTEETVGEDGTDAGGCAVAAGSRESGVAGLIVIAIGLALVRRRARHHG